MRTPLAVRRRHAGAAGPSAASASEPAVSSAAAPFPSLHDSIYTSLRAALMAGDLLPGQTVSLRTLAEQFGTSAIPVRDALKRLVAEHALAMLPNRTIVVPTMSRKRFQEILAVRLHLETALARQAAEKIGQGGIDALEAINAQMQAASGAGDAKQYLLANQRFHFQLYSAAESLVMFPIVESLWLQVGPFLNGVFNVNGVAHAADNHSQILKSLRRRDAIGAADAIAHDLGDAADVVLASQGFFSESEAH
jgi:DNA-binding GntR family transcriptional regulator